MARCDYCGTEYEPRYTCNDCSQHHYPDCRLPEAHECTTSVTGRSKKVFESDAPSTLGPSRLAPGSGNTPGIWSQGRSASSSTRSVDISISTRFRRLLIALTLVVVGLLIGTAITPLDQTVDEIGSAVSPAVNETEPTLSPTQTATLQSQAAGTTPDNQSPALNQTRIERAAHIKVNEIREERGLKRVEWDPELQSIAAEYSISLAERGYLTHTDRDGDGFEKRYEEAGYECRVAAGGNRYYVGGENLAFTYAASDVRAGNRGVVNHNGNETKIGRGIVKGWMNSTGHRENILQPEWRREGIGVAFAEDDDELRVYATQNFC